MFGFWHHKTPPPTLEKPAISLEINITKELLLKIMTLLVGAGVLGSHFLPSNFNNPKNPLENKNLHHPSEKVGTTLDIDKDYESPNLHQP